MTGKKKQDDKARVGGDYQDFSGASFSNISGQLLVGMFKNTVATLNSSGEPAKEDLATALVEVAKAVEASEEMSKEEKEEVLGVLNSLGDEAVKPKPNKTILTSLKDGLMGAVKAIPDVATAALALLPLLDKLPLGAG